MSDTETPHSTCPRIALHAGSERDESGEWTTRVRAEVVPPGSESSIETALGWLPGYRDNRSRMERLGAQMAPELPAPGGSLVDPWERR